MTDGGLTNDIALVGSVMGGFLEAEWQSREVRPVGDDEFRHDQSFFREKEYQQIEKKRKKPNS